MSDEVGCGYTLTHVSDGGNSYGVCHGLDQAVSFIKNISTYPKIFMQSLGFKKGK